MTENETAAAVQYQAGAVDATLPGLAVVGVKLMGLYALLLAIPHVTLLPSVFLMTRAATTEMWMSYALPGGAYVAAAIVLLFGAEWVVARLLGVSRGGTLPTTIDERLQAIAFSIFGAMLIMWGGAGLLGAVTNYALERSLTEEGLASGGPDYGEFVVPAVELFGGLALFLGGRGLAALWHRMRYGGVRVRSAE